MRPFRLKNRRLMENARQNRHLQVPIQSGSVVSRKQFRSPCKKTKKEKLDLNYHEGNCCCRLCGQLKQRYNNQAVTNTIVRKPEKLVIVS